MNSIMITHTRDTKCATTGILSYTEGQLVWWLEKLQEYQFSIMHRPGKKHGNADALSRLPCKQCGRASHYDNTTVALLASNGLTFGYSSDQLRDMQMHDNYIGQVLRWKEQGEQPPPDFVKTQPVPLRHLIQQWEQLVVNNGILYRQYVQPRAVQDYLQLVVPTEMRESILDNCMKELPVDTWVKTKPFIGLKKSIIGQDISMM